PHSKAFNPTSYFSYYRQFTGSFRFWHHLCSAKSRCDLTQQFPRSNIHGAARREHLALVSGNWLATHADGCLGAAAARCRNPECLAPSSHEVVPDCNGQPTPA